MLHRLPSDPALAPMARAIEACTHCGLCLPVCPTFAETHLEAESPRGRIILMRLGLEQSAPVTDIQPHLDCCVRCRACEQVCPAQVPYHDLLIRYLDHTRSRGRPAPAAPGLRAVLRIALPHPGWFRFFAAAAALARPFRELLGEPARAALDLLPERLPVRRDTPDAYAGRGLRKGVVALLPGCIGSVLEPGITQAAVELLTRNGFDVVFPERPVCCGSISFSLDDPEAARRAAAGYLESLPPDLAAVISTSALCANGLRDYPGLFAGTPWEEKARWVATHTWDLCSFLLTLDRRPFPDLPEPVRAAYHGACQPSYRSLPEEDSARRLLREIPGLELVDMDEPGGSCGSTGVYPILQSGMAKRLGRRKIRDFQKTGAAVLIAGNPGCLTQLRYHAAQAAVSATFLHPAEVLARAALRQPLLPPPPVHGAG